MKPLDSSAAVKLKLEQTLAQWQHWRCEPPLQAAPHLDRPLSGGLSNHNFLVSSASRHYVVRIDGVNPARHGINRNVEYLAQQSAGNVVLAPMPRYFNPELGAMVCDYFTADAKQVPTPADLAQLCLGIHHLPARHLKLDLGNRIKQYENQLGRTAKPLPPEAIRRAIAKRLNRSEISNTPASLCHNDLLPANLIVSKGKLFALDWEYVAMGSPWFDLAVACEGQQYDKGQIERFLFYYLQRKPDQKETGQLHLFVTIYRYIELLWHLEQATPELATAVLESRLPRVEDKLA